MNAVALRAKDVLRNDVMLRINDVALRANGFPPRVLKNAGNCDIIESEGRWCYEERRQIISSTCFVVYVSDCCSNGVVLASLHTD